MYRVTLMVKSSLIPLSKLVMDVIYVNSSPSRENGSVHVATRFRPSTSMVRLDGGWGSAVVKRERE